MLINIQCFLPETHPTVCFFDIFLSSISPNCTISNLNFQAFCWMGWPSPLPRPSLTLAWATLSSSCPKQKLLQTQLRLVNVWWTSSFNENIRFIYRSHINYLHCTSSHNIILHCQWSLDSPKNRVITTGLQFLDRVDNIRITWLETYTNGQLTNKYNIGIYKFLCNERIVNEF